jgi:drug/metabolite transporter (DMT)-like permease
MRSFESRLWAPLGGIALVVLLWAGNTIVSKYILREASPVLISLVRFQLVGVLFYIPVFLLLWRAGQRLTRREWPLLILLGLVGTTGSQVLFMIGLLTTPATEAGIYQIVTPIFVVLIAWLWIGERLSLTRIAGIGLACVGSVVLITDGGALALGGGDVLGSLLIMASNAAWAVYTVLSKRLVTRRSPLLVLTAANLTAMVAMWPIAGLMGVFDELPRVLEWSPTAWLVMVYLVAITGTLSQWLYQWTIRELGPSRVSAALYLKPVFVAALAVAFLAEEPTLVTLLSGLTILAGVWLVNRPRAPRAAEREGDPMKVAFVR